MRLKERIPIFAENVDVRRMLLFDLELPLSEEEIQTVEANFDNVIEFWKSNPDLRFTQALVVTGCLPNYRGFWYYTEEHEILEKQGVEPSKYLLWGQNYDKDGNRLEKTVIRPIEQLDTDHIQAILDGGHVEKDSLFEKTFLKELKKR